MKTIKLFNTTFLFVILLLASCSRQADLLQADKHIFPAPTFMELNAENPSAPIQSKMRGATILVFPNEDEVEEYSYISKESEIGGASDFELVTNQLSYKDKIPSLIKKDLSGGKKIETMAFIIFATGSVRDDLYVKMHENDKKMDLLDKKLEPILKKYVCYNPVAGRRRSYTCSYKEVESTTGPVIAKSCRSLKKLTFTDFNSEQKTTFKEDLKVCNKIKADKEQIKKQNNLYSEIRDKAKGLVVDILDTLGKITNLSHFSPVIGLSDGDDESKRSILKLSEKRDSIDQLKLFVDFGLSGANSGTQEYSLQNGKIANLVFFKNENNVYKLEFSIVTENFTIDADMAMSDHRDFDVRFAGSTEVHYNDGTLRKGLIKFELNHL
ncbi:MAG: hypothetical protein ISR65_09295 [Bacteriovoracaceae bacterium]|nr:hypothetical protein [Bacteriovoracaceae bacterium]